MQRRSLTLWLIILLLPFSFGMGSNQASTSPEKTPVPLQKYSAVFVDQSEVLTQCKDVSIEGGTFVQGKRGEGSYTIGFDKIASILFRLQGGNLTGMIKLRDGSSLDLVLNGNQKAYGNTKYGAFKIKLLDLKKMTIGGKE